MHSPKTASVDQTGQISSHIAVHGKAKHLLPAEGLEGRVGVFALAAVQCGPPPAHQSHPMRQQMLENLS